MYGEIKRILKGDSKVVDLVESRSLKRNDSTERWSPEKMSRRVQRGTVWFSKKRKQYDLGTDRAIVQGVEVLGTELTTNIVRPPESM